MMLVQKQPNFNISSPHFALNHRRHPSAPPAVVVQATRTPGLLSIQRAQQQQLRAKASPKPRQAVAHRVLQPVRPETQQQLLKPSPEIVEKKPSPQLSPEKRGRQPAKVKAKTARSSSHSSVRGRRNHTRQPSPPNSIQNPSQAEVPSTPPRKSTAANIFDSFSDDSVSPPVRAAPTLASHPSGKLARRRQTQAASSFSTPPARAIPVPQRPNSIPPTLSRSLPARPFKGKTTPDTSNWKPFPICDDSTEVGSIFDDYSPPMTPTRQRPSRSKRYDDGPRTAPLTTSVATFPFNLSPNPSAPRKNRRHVRTPSDGVFHMSDEDVSSQSISEDSSSSDEMPAGPKRKALRAPRPGMTQQEIEGYFASSTFQNSPSPEELPPPAFL
ncbi:uncharacterized protein EV420DRAFT_338402 [Desarmillaria tabescens]|uniref:Uncharacterized protein n=1 Tax=Armillaria tabescens TaxID=1929756 RepID=A0AA39KD07_ARMTA|nr:uncharacterized protein EV420DRAFT_338402 [Desarmillaria tabescens]KAK0458917.1 hypothetical protein EV420DRAFT_338402 [Desarmillaria tabescens]